MRKNAIAANWKMNKTVSEAIPFVEKVVQKAPSFEQVETIVCAPFPHLPKLAEAVRGSDVKISAQNMHYEENGAFTGEVSPAMLEDIGVTHVVLGHSERRAYYNETDDTVRKKVDAAFDHHLTPIVCVGESLEQREANETMDHVAKQVKRALAGLSNEQMKQVIIAYEPIWAIGTGKTATSDEAEEVCQHIRQVVAEMTTEGSADEMRIQYGGSVKPANIDEFLNKSNIDGGLIGGASLEVDSFLELVEAGKHE